MALGKLAFHLLEWPAEPGERLFRNADAGICNGNAHPAFGRPGVNGDTTAFGGKLHRIRQQVQHDLLEQARVGGQAYAATDAGDEAQPLVISSGRDHAHRVVEERLELDLFGIKPDAARLDFRHVEDIVDHFEQILTALTNVTAILAIFVGPKRTEHSRLHDFGKADDGVERSPQLMAHIGKKL